MSSAQDLGAAGEVAAVDKTTLVEYLAAGCKPRSEWRIGTEHEKFAYRLKDHRPVPYGGDSGIRAILEGLTRFGWEPIFEDGNLVALTDNAGGSVTLEPAGQVELSGAPLLNIHETCGEIDRHLRQVKTVGAELDVGFLGIGYQPKWPRAALPWMPKERYRIMREYMPKKGNLGLAMMQATCTVQVNLDFDYGSDDGRDVSHRPRPTASRHCTIRELAVRRG